PTWVEVGGAIGRALVRRLEHPDDELARRTLQIGAERSGAEWFARLGRCLAGAPGRTAEQCEADGDPWGRLAAVTCDGLTALASGRSAVAALTSGVELTRDLAAPLVEAVVLDALAVAQDREHLAVAADTARAAERLRRSIQTGATPLQSYRSRFEEIAAAARDLAPATTAPRVTIRCLGGFSIAVGDESVDLGALRPRARSVLHLLALHADHPVHRDTLLDALWPDVDVAAGLRSLQVAVSAIRKELAGAPVTIDRTAEGYVLATAGAGTDVQALEVACADVHAARRRGDHPTAVDAAQEVVGMVTGELLPEDGPADWVVPERDRVRQLVVGAAVAGADSALECGRPDAAVEIAQRALHAERYDDRAWRVLIDATEAAGDTCAAARARESYEAMLADLDVPATSRAGTRAR
ncbi:MAG: winged helix-turn-helix domain-containing protein, partial [Ilumatobacteraceae bacterium]|nr:winged helix-turn-helix domain-containing protein [Ilumatobacteraceae bacterium]